MKKKRIYADFIKRVLDFVSAVCMLIVVSPIMLIIAICVKIKLGGKVIFYQERPGKNEKLFRLYKFRSMTNLKDESGKLLSDDMRITPFGKKLRKTSLDELPELFNILKGDMSFVGPRPLLKEYIPYYNEEEHHRHDIRPGLTGLAQINGRNNIGWEEKFNYDLEYIRTCSFGGDVKILFTTVKKVLCHSDIQVGSEIKAGRFDDHRRKQLKAGEKI